MTEYNFYMSERELKDNIITKDNSSTEYIILQNNILQSKYQEILEQKKKVEKELEDNEYDIESLEKSKTCLQGYVKNQYEVIEHLKQLIVKTEFLSNKWKHHYLISLFVPAPLMILNFVRLPMEFIIGIMVGYITIQLGINFEIIKNGKKKEYELEEIKENVNNVDKSNEYLDDLIDNF